MRETQDTGIHLCHFREVDLNARNVGGYTALMYAAYIGHDSIVSLLIDAQADVNLSNSKGLTPLMLAASCGNETVCNLLQQVSLFQNIQPPICSLSCLVSYHVSLSHISYRVSCHVSHVSSHVT